MSATISFILDTRRVKNENKYPIKLRVTFNRKTRYYQTIFDLSKLEWEKLPATRISNELQFTRNKLKDAERQAKFLAAEMTFFSFGEFEKEFIHGNPVFRQRNIKEEAISPDLDGFDYSPFFKKFPLLLESVTKTGLLSHSYSGYLKKLIREGRISTAVSYHCSYVSLTKFKGDVPLSAITVSWLQEYENWLKNQDISPTTIGIYLRPLRAIFNEAIEDGIIKREKCYPFGKRKYRIPSSKNIKKALDLSDIKRIYNYKCDPAQPTKQMAKDYWLFSYFANGMNPKDIANLKYKNIDGDYIIFERTKTQHSLRSDPRPITVFISDDMKAIMERWGNENKTPANYLFPILQSGLTPLRQYELVQNFVGIINDWMKRILKNLGIDKKATTYVARHTFSTVLKKIGASTEFIQEALGHTDLKTTENYLGSFDKEMKKELAGVLTSFKNHQPEDAEIR
ncbi:MAG: site-specific integrase [Ferruginibacter sp.]|nr:site-specific integrase [Bacteroidota bacterium]MBX2919730.1 site-specific integrase [Ferruginibacter sp.]